MNQKNHKTVNFSKEHPSIEKIFSLNRFDINSKELVRELNNAPFLHCSLLSLLKEAKHSIIATKADRLEPSILPTFYNFDVPVSLAPHREVYNSLRKFEEEVSDLRETIDIEGYEESFVPQSDIACVLADKKAMDNTTVNKYVNEAPEISEEDSERLFYTLFCPLTKGKPTDIVNGSYSKLYYPLGEPVCSRVTDETRSFLNFEWAACRNISVADPSDAKGLRQLADQIMAAEDRLSAFDIEVAQNRTTRRLIQQYGPKMARMTHIVEEESKRIYDFYGPLMVELIRIYGKMFLQCFKERLNERAVLLGKAVIKGKYRWIETLEQHLPSQRSKYQNSPKFTHFEPHLIYVGSEELHYKVDEVVYLSSFGSILHEILNRDGEADAPYINECFKKVTMELRAAESIAVSFSHAAAVFTAVNFLSSIRSIITMDKQSSAGVKVALNVGISTEDMHGISRVFSVVCHSVLKNRLKEGSIELAGLLDIIDYDDVYMILSAASIFIRSIKQFAKDLDLETDTVPINIHDGSVYLAESSLIRTLDLSLLGDDE